jgi:cytochrome c biogenesis protein CcdA
LSIADLITNWAKSVMEKIMENPIKNIVIIIVSFVLGYYLIVEIFKIAGILTVVGYAFACIYGLAKIIDDPYRIIRWAVGYIIGSVAIKLIFEEFVPQITSATSTSIFASLIILYVCVRFYLKAKELKES